MKFTLIHHNKTKDEELVVNTKDLGPEVVAGDIIEIYHEECDGKQPRLLLQIPQMTQSETNVIKVPKDSISVSQVVANAFLLKHNHQVIVNNVDPQAVALEHVLLTFKDQYLGRSEMWRLKKCLENTIVYKNKKIEFCYGSIRLQVYEMWSMGTNVSCGYITENTKIVFRSSTSMFYLFIQMSSEMWEFDYFGDLYFEKAVKGFLAELFSKWKEKGSNHEVTIVLFSRTYFRASSIEDFPEEERECLQEDYFGRFYEDFYRVAIQNERFDDWSPILTLLMKHFYDYPNTVLKHHKNEMPEAYISDASEGNFLEVLNISLNVFEKHYLDRSFDRTGQMSVVITPGVGVFQVDRELTNITKQRIIDNGVGSDLVCLGEQPLHAVPLFKFHKQRGSVRGDDYSFPHTWINQSFYSTNKKMYYNSFIPRIKVPKQVIDDINNNQGKICLDGLHNSSSSKSTPLPKSIIDYDNYDAQVFKLPVSQSQNKYNSLQRPVGGRKKTISQSAAQPPPSMLSIERKLSEPDLFHSLESVSESISQGSHSINTSLFSKSSTINIPLRINEAHVSQSFGALNIEGGSAARLSHLDIEDSPNKMINLGTSAGSSPCEQPSQSIGMNKLPPQPRKSLVNPFNPSHMTIKRTSNRRRWTHIFPKDSKGVLIQVHHHTKASNDPDDLLQSTIDEELNLINEDGTPAHPPNGRTPQSSTDKISRQSSGYKLGEMEKKKQDTLLWGATGEQPWDAAITTGVDWLSLTLPACLPITTDYFPEEKLNLEYEVASEYSLLPYDVSEQLAFGQKNMTTQEVFHELISQRLAQGFQICVDPDPIEKEERQSVRSSSYGGPGREEVIEVYKLSIGDVYHLVKFNGYTISVSIYRPRHPHIQLSRRYKYKFQAPDMGKYAVARAEFYTERPEKYKWNHLDNYLCSRGENLENFPLTENLKYWRTRILVVPDAYQSITKFLVDSDGPVSCDLYKALSKDEQQKLVDSFLKFIEAVHKIKRHGGTKRTKDSTGMRERLGSNRIAEHPRTRPEHGQHEGSGDLAENKHSSQSNEQISKEEECKKLSTKSSQREIIEAMKDASKGLSFLNNQCGLPAFSFISADATAWIIDKVEDITSVKDAVILLENMVKNGLICHASGKKTNTFIYGFYLYFITSDTPPPIYDVFDSEWHEVSVFIGEGNSNNTHSSNECPVFLQQDLPNLKEEKGKPSKIHCDSTPYHTGRLDIDISNKSERHEWGHIKYQGKYFPLRAYEIVVQWLCATGTIVTDLITNWQRRAFNCGLHLFPIPCDPFAAPYTYQCNPLRGPIAIHLNEACLKDQDKDPFHDFDENMRPYRLYLFQVFILEKFGFIPCYKETDCLQNQFVHVTGSMFVLVNTPGIDALLDNDQEPKATKLSMSNKPEFLWVFNHMLTKRWKSPTSGDEILGEKILQDFRDFCSNKENRLRSLWDTCLSAMSMQLKDNVILNDE